MIAVGMKGQGAVKLTWLGTSVAPRGHFDSSLPINPLTPIIGAYPGAAAISVWVIVL